MILSVILGWYTKQINSKKWNYSENNLYKTNFQSQTLFTNVLYLQVDLTKFIDAIQISIDNSFHEEPDQDDAY